MRWIGSLVGGYLGSRLLAPMGFFFSFVGLFLGAMLGHQAEMSLRGRKRQHSVNRSRVFYGSIAAMFAKMAKADGVVSRDEIAVVEQAFRRLGFSPAARSFAIDAFRRAKNDQYSIYDYAHEFAQAVDSLEVRELLYEILWDLACVDGSVGPAELLILQRIPRALGIRLEWYGYFFSQRIGGRRAGGRAEARDALAEAYAVLGAGAGDSADVLKRKYRELAKKNHPDALRAQGLPEEMVGKATERMSRINEAWARIKEARGL